MFIHPDIFREVAKKMEIDLEVNQYCMIAHFDNFEIFVPYVTWGDQLYQEEGYLNIYYTTEDVEDGFLEDFMSEDGIMFFEALVLEKMNFALEKMRNIYKPIEEDMR